jgi:uncharacterized membrane protein
MPADAVRARLPAIEVLRGLIMIVMALNHTRDYLDSRGQEPTDLATASASALVRRGVFARLDGASLTAIT